MTLCRVVGFVGLALCAAQGAAQDAVTLKFADPKAGDRIKVTEDETATVTTTAVVQGKAQTKVDKSTKTLVYVEECLTPPAAAGKKPLKATRTFEKIDGTKDGKPLDAAAVGKPILIEKAGDKYTFTVGNAPLAGTLAEVLDQAYNKADGPTAKDMFPTTPVKPGEPWKMDAKKGLAALADDKFTIDLDKATLDGKLVKAYQKDGAGYGVIEMQAALPITGLGPKNPLTVKPGSVMTMAVTGDGCIDGSTATGDTATKLRIKIEATTMGVDLSIVADVDQKKTSVQLPKK